MLERLAENISFYLIVNKIINIEEQDIYIYGLQLIISIIFTSISILIIGTLIGELLSAIIYLSIYFLLKSYTGGYHAKHYYQCYFYSILVYIFLLYINCITLDSYKPMIGLLSIAISIIVIFKWAPIENRNNPKTKVEMIKNRKIAIYRIIFLNVFIIAGYMIFDNLINIWFMLAITELSLAYSIFKQKLLERRENSE